MLAKTLLTLRFAFVCILSLLATASLAQTTINVGPGQAYATIQAGINAANAGDTVMVAPGTYFENIDFLGKAITVTSSQGAAETVIDGGSNGPAVTFKTGETAAAVISGFTIQHGGQFGWLTKYSKAGIGNIYLSDSAPTILNNTITLSNCWGVESYYSAPLIQNNTISATQDPSGNCSSGGGAGILVWGGYGGNNPQSANSPLILGNDIEDNVESGLEAAGGNGGAGVAVWGGSPIIMDNLIRNNSSPGGSGGAINVQSGNNVVVVQNLIYGNSAGCGGGAIAVQTSTGSSTGISSFFANNTMVDNVTLAKLSDYTECADISQIYPWPDTSGSSNPTIVFMNNIISGSTIYPAVNCSWVGPPSEADQPTFEYNILRNAGGPFFGSYCVDVSDKYNNTVSDPQFLSSSTGDYHLDGTSPAIDSGLYTVLQTFLTMAGLSWTKDFEGNPRVQDATGKSCAIDMGVYEYPGTQSQCGTTEVLTSSLSTAIAGQSVTFTAQLSAATGIPTGSVQFLDGKNLLSTQTVSGKGSASYSTSSLAVGSHTITANYQPTGTFGAATASLTQVINGYATSTALTCRPNPVIVSYPADFDVTVTSANGTPTGSVALTEDGSLVGTFSLISGKTFFTNTFSTVGTHNIVATYTPTGSFAASSASCSEVVSAFPTTSFLNVAPPTSTYGSPVTLTATVSPARVPNPGTPTDGVVTFYNGASSIGTATLVGGVATLVPDILPGGSYKLTCTYAGSSIFATSNCNSVPVTVNAAPTALALSSSNNPAPALSTITFTARLTVNGQSSGGGDIIHLTFNGQNVNVATDATGSANYTIGTLGPNSYTVTASFKGNSNLLASSATLTEVFTALPSSTSLTASPNPGDVNQSVTMVATVSSPTASSQTIGGTVIFYDGSASLGSAQVTASGSATLAADFTTVGVHNLTAAYGGDADVSGSTSAVFEETIVAGDFSISAQPGAASLYTGEAAALQVNVSILRGFNQPLALTCTGLPANTTCAFSPASLPGGQGAASLVIQTAAPHERSGGSGSASGSGPGIVLGALTLLLLPGWRRRRGFLAGLSVVLLAIGVGMGMAGCGSPNPITGGTPPGTYQVAVTATAGTGGSALAHSSVVTLTVKSLF